MQGFWNERYARDEYAYGEEPNVFFKDQLSRLKPGRLLLPAEGEGRNAVFAARVGWDVVATDWSEEGKTKAMALAAKHGVEINYTVGDLAKMEFPAESFDAVGLVYAHFPPALRTLVHRKFVDSLKPGGVVILEAFNKHHLEYNSRNANVGGPKQLEMLYDGEELRRDFLSLQILMLEERVVDLNEGTCHCGTGAVVRFVGRKPLV